MNLKVINSNSKGNAYILEGSDSALLIECGVNFNEIKKAIDFNIMKIDLCTLSHNHGDHAKAFKQVQQNGIQIVASTGTFEALKIGQEARDIEIKHGQSRTFKEWTITAFNVNHDVKEPLGFIIEHKDCGKVLFVTDTNLLKYSFPFPFDNIIIESNYCEELAEEWKKGKANQFIERRRLSNHMSYQTALLTLSKLDLSQCKNIVLIHLSDGLTDEKRFKKETEQRFGIPTTIAAPNVSVDFSLKPY